LYKSLGKKPIPHSERKKIFRVSVSRFWKQKIRQRQDRKQIMESVDVQISNPRGFTAIQRDPDKPNFNPAA